jgi:SAM-dependent methyltransferase
MYVSPRPSREEIASYYGAEYAPHRAVEDGARRRRRRGARLSGRWRFLEGMRPGAILDVGCGAGHELLEPIEAGWRAYGIEPAPPAAEAARRLGVEIVGASAEDADLSGRQFDAIAMIHALEHLHDPAAAMRNLRRAIRPDGRMYILVPNVASVQFALLRARWRELDLPRHLYFFTPRTLARLAAQAGFRIASWRCRSGTRTLRDALPSPMRRLWRGPVRASFTAAVRVADLLRAGDRAEYVLTPTEPAPRA